MSYGLRGGLAPGLYRIDLRSPSAVTSTPAWINGPVFFFDGSKANALQANGEVQSTVAPNTTGPFKGDYDGDGLVDLIKRTTTTGQVAVAVNKSTNFGPVDVSNPSGPKGFATWNSNGTGGFTDFVSSQSTAPLLVGDFNGDGRDDVVQPDMNFNSWSVMRSVTAGAFEKVVTPVTGLIDPDLPDFAWDSQSKVLSWNAVNSPNSSSVRTYELRVVLNGVGNTYPTVATTITVSQIESATAGLTASLATLAAGEYTVFVRTTVNGRTSQWSEGFGFSTNVNGASAWQNYVVGDFNGDRRDDIAAYNTLRQQWVVSISTGTTFEQTVWTSGFNFNFSGGTSDVYSRSTVIDVNGDGRKDVVAKNNMNNQWVVNISTGTSFLTQTWAAPAFLSGSTVSPVPMVADVDADGEEDLIVFVGGDLRVAFSRDNSFQDSAGGLAWSALTGMPANTVVVDMNNDGRADLVGFDATGKSLVSLSGTTGFGTPTLWEVNSTTPWAIQLQDSGVVVADYNYRTRSVYAAFDSVHKTIDFEAYRGLKKGADGTQSTKSGNAWDQSNLLGTQIADGSFTATKYATGRMGLTAAQVKSWLTTTTIPFDYFSQAGLNPTLVNADLLTIDHAWLQVWLPTATGLNWVDLNPSLKASISAAPGTATAPFTATDLKSYLTQSSNSFAADFDAGGVTSGHHAATIPTQLQFDAGGAVVMTDAAWPLVSGVPDYKIQTSHNTPTNILVGEKAVNGTLSASVTALQVGTGTLQDFRVYGRATQDYEVGLEWISGQPGPGRIYERHGNDVFALTPTYSTPPTSEIPWLNPIISYGYFPTDVKLIVTDSTVTAYVHWRYQDSNNVHWGRYKMVADLTQTVANKPASVLSSGRFGIQTTGTAHHFVDNIVFSGQDASSTNPLAWTVGKTLSSTDPVVKASASGIGVTTSIRQTASATIPVSLIVARVPASQWAAGDWQTSTVKLVGPAGSTFQTTRPANAPAVTPNRVADLSRRNIVVRIATDGRSASLVIDGVVHETTTLTAPAGAVLQLEVDSQVPGMATQPKQLFTLTPGGSAQVVLRAGQYSSLDLASSSDQLATAYDQIPVTATGVPTTTFTGTAVADVAEKLLAYATVRLLTSSEQSEDSIARLTHSVLVRPNVSAGLISSTSTLLYQPDSVYFARPKDLTIDYPIGKLLYVPRDGSSVLQTDALQQSRALLTLIELAARESELLSEVSEKPALSALNFLSLARVNGGTVRRLRKGTDGNYYDDFDTSVPGTTNLTTLLSLGSQTHRAAAFTAIKDQIDAGGIVTVATAFRAVNGWTGLGWLHENYTTSIPLIESLLKSDTDGRVLRGGVLGAGGNQAASNLPLLPDGLVTPDSYQGVVKKSDTDFTLNIPGLSIPFTRTWTSSRSSESSPNQIVTADDISNFGSGWLNPFSQQLDIATIYESVVYYQKKKSLFGSVSQGAPVFANTARKGEAAVIAWRRDDGSTAVFTPNGVKTRMARELL